MLKKSIATLVVVLLAHTVCAQADDVQCPTLIERGWRGIDCLYCLNSRAPGNSRPITDLIKATCLKNVMLSFVVDGSFGWKDGEIEQAVNELSTAGRNLWLHFYVYNGPAQRRWQYKVFESFAVMDPLLFRRKIVSDPVTKRAFSDIVTKRILPAARLAVSRGGRVTIAPGLEDNLDDAAFKKSVRLVQGAMGNAVPYKIVRSSCFRCERGTGRFLPGGALLEEHDDLLFPYRWNGIINTDGRYFRFANEGSNFPALSELATSWIQLAERQRNAFLLWIPHYQDTPPGLVPRPLNERKFRGPTESEAWEIVEFMRR